MNRTVKPSFSPCLLRARSGLPDAMLKTVVFHHRLIFISPCSTSYPSMHFSIKIDVYSDMDFPFVAATILYFLTVSSVTYAAILFLSVAIFYPYKKVLDMVTSPVLL